MTYTCSYDYDIMQLPNTVLLDEAARTDITRTLTRDWFYRRALHIGGWQVFVVGFRSNFKKIPTHTKIM